MAVRAPQTYTQNFGRFGVQSRLLHTHIYMNIGWLLTILAMDSDSFVKPFDPMWSGVTAITGER
jgi:hypothetical protein